MEGVPVLTSDGSHTLFVPSLNEHYHSVKGAVRESMTVYIENGYDFCTLNPVRILEIGFGTGLNARLTLIRSETDGRRVHYTAIEKYPLSMEVISMLNYPSFCSGSGPELFSILHNAEWNRNVPLTDRFTLNKSISDFTSDPLTGKFDLIYFDAFGPDKQPEMWTEELFMKISEATGPAGVLVTYSSKGTVKRILRACGFEVFLLPGPPGKREVLRAVKKT